MAEVLEFLGEPVSHERVMLVKRLRQRDGIRREIEGFPLDLFGAQDWQELAHNIEMAVGMIDSEIVRISLNNALGFQLPGASVIERRQKLADVLSISVRTLERLEDEGARAVSYYIEKMLKAEFFHEQAHVLEKTVDLLRWSAHKQEIDLPDAAWTSLLGAWREITRAYNHHAKGKSNA